jgi:hypothetical protein
MEKRCGNCIHWASGGSSPTEPLLMCRRFPAPVLKGPGDCCGEWSSAGRVWGLPVMGDPLDRLPLDGCNPPRVTPSPLRRVCSYCKVEYAKGELGARASHGICPACVKLLDALQAAGYGAGQANDILLGLATGKAEPYDWPRFFVALLGWPLPALGPRGSLPDLASALVDWHAAHHQDEEGGE